MESSLKYIFVHCQHRSGSTALLNTLGSLPGVYAIPEELNLLERRFVRNSVWRFAMNKWDDPENIFGSIWNSNGTFSFKTRGLINECRNFSSAGFGHFVRIIVARLVSCFLETDNTTSNISVIACKYVAHVSASEKLIDFFSKTSHIILVRDLSAIYFSKINDPHMRRLRRVSLHRYCFKRLAILIFFALDYRIIVKLAYSAATRPNCYVVRYSRMEYDLKVFAATVGLDFDSVKGIAQGKASSQRGAISKPSWIELIVLRVLGGRSYID